MVWKPSTPWTANSTSPQADQSYQNGDRSAGDGSYTITGIGFGTKSGIPVFEDFESETLGAYPAGFDVAAGELLINNNEFQGTSCSTNNPRFGTRCIEHDNSVEDFPGIHRVLTGTSQKHYFSCFFYWSGTIDTVDTVWKFGRIGANNVYSGNPKAGESWTSGNGSAAPSGFGGEMVTSDGIVGFGANAAELASAASIYAQNQWHFYELELYTGTSDGGDSWFEVRVNGDVSVRWENLSFLTAALSDLPDWVLTPINGLDLGPSVTMYMDGVYSDESRARCVMTDSAVYANSTSWAVQPIASYSDTSVTVTGKKQVFSSGVTAYLHLFNDDGVLVSEGNAVTVEEDV